MIQITWLLCQVKKFVRNSIILARIDSYFTDYKRHDIVVRSKEFLKVNFDKESNNILNAEGYGIVELSNYTRNYYQVYEDEFFIGYKISNCVADITIVISKN